jgi:hypothetical protein
MAMAWRIEDAVAHGEIDNTVEGHTTGHIWLAGRDEPLILSLNGDCWRDLAGTRLQFENPAAIAVPELTELDMDQCGIIGDMTASRKNKVPTVSDEEFDELYHKHLEIPYEWRNTLYLEWFSEINGRVLIETTGFQLTISPHEWQMDEDAEDAQKLANLDAMRDFTHRVIDRREPDGPEREGSGELDEYAWEERLKESDRLTDAYQEVLEKYMEDHDSEQKEAFVMGWDGLLDALAEREESGDLEYSNDPAARDLIGDEEGDQDDEDDEEEAYDDDDEEEEDSIYRDTNYADEEDEDEGGGGEDHPLQAMAQELAIHTMSVIQRDAGEGTPSYILVTQLLQVSGKLAGVLYQSNDDDYAPETGFVLAVLKRCLSWLNDAVGACLTLMAEEQDPEKKAALADIRRSIFEVRDGITELRRELKA